jgi:hypothetical protein
MEKGSKVDAAIRSPGLANPLNTTIAGIRIGSQSHIGVTVRPGRHDSRVPAADVCPGQESGATRPTDGVRSGAVSLQSH